jgi:aminopeptidase N
LKPALEALSEIGHNRKIFFLTAWLNAFIDGQQSPAGQAAVHRYLRTPAVDCGL